MKLFGQIVKTVVNGVLLPVDLARDLGNSMIGEPGVKHTAKRIRTLKQEASDDE